ncbi:MAG: SWIM zinc finger domain-containing protein [Symploca sp. SIO3C6]|uniref:SWIM zinc finger domain-containing protein n=1 Tax=Symploca sp. SIO1C4 TaxID=2607765 RepID=A0A6B3NJ58_9CYAN|nr:SWIM zinc finger domain-containing protein [Symploca sp. SIO3C6]NER29238.1 SWIM zinc finger domain-containing protein [Symploca sp. SIO1C4]
MPKPEKIEESPKLEELLDRLNEIQIQRLLQELVAQQPELLDVIERYVNQITSLAPQPQLSKPLRCTTVDPAPWRGQVRQILRDGVRYLEEGWEEDPITEELLEIIGEAQVFTEHEEVNNALVILEAITSNCVDGWDEVYEYGAENYEVASALNEAWCEAILSAELTPEEKVDLQVNLEAWQDEWNADFAMSLEALRQGWDYPQLQQVLQGKITELGTWEGEAPYYADDLALIRLKILDRQERYQKYLYLAQAEGQTQQYLTMLGRLGRVSEAMQSAQTQMSSRQEAFALAQVLREQGSPQQALKIAQTGLSLPGNCQYDLAIWTSELAFELGEGEAALAARVKAFQAKPSFEDYSRVRSLASEAWSNLKVELLDHLRNHQAWGIHSVKVEIFLHEQLIDDAINVVSELRSYDAPLIEQVMDEAVASRPNWVIENACRRAESIMDAGKAQYYYYAVEWLRKARAAYHQAGRKREWSVYRTKLMDTHARKYKLMAMLKQGNLD